MAPRDFLGEALGAIGALGARLSENERKVTPEMPGFSLTLHERASGTPAAGAVTLSFPAPKLGRVWQGSVTIPSALGTDSWLLTIGGQLYANVGGAGPFGPVQVQGGQVLSLVGTVSGTAPMIAVLSGIDDPNDAMSPYTGPIALPGAGTTFPQTLLATFPVGSGGGIVTLPTNCETLIIVGTYSAFTDVTATGQTSGIIYHSVAIPSTASVGTTWTWLIDVSESLDTQIHIVIPVPANMTGPTYAIADSGVHITVDALLAEALAVIGQPLQTYGIQIAGSDGTDARVIRTDAQGITYAIPSAPDTATGDHPPNELLAASINSGSTLLAAPGGGLRYRIFAVIIATTNVNGIGSFAYVAATKTGATVYLGFAAASPPSASPIPLSGLALDANTAVTVGIVGGSVGTTVYATAIYTLEAV